jgi:hypothetical protein
MAKVEDQKSHGPHSRLMFVEWPLAGARHLEGMVRITVVGEALPPEVMEAIKGETCRQTPVSRGSVT